MSEYDCHTTYPIPKYWPKWFHRLRKPCSECERLTGMRDNTYCSIAQSHFGKPNDILCMLCGKDYHWVWIGMGQFGGYWGWRHKVKKDKPESSVKQPKIHKPCSNCGEGRFLREGEKCLSCSRIYDRLLVEKHLKGITNV